MARIIEFAESSLLQSTGVLQLASLLPDNCVLATGCGRLSPGADALLLCPSGLVSLNLEVHSGSVRPRSEGPWRLSDGRRLGDVNPFDEVQRGARALEEEIRVRFGPHTPPFSVQYLVVLTDPEVQIDLSDPALEEEDSRHVANVYDVAAALDVLFPNQPMLSADHFEAIVDLVRADELDSGERDRLLGVFGARGWKDLPEPVASAPVATRPEDDDEVQDDDEDSNGGPDPEALVDDMVRRLGAGAETEAPPEVGPAAFLEGDPAPVSGEDPPSGAWDIQAHVGDEVASVFEDWEDEPDEGLSAQDIFPTSDEVAEALDLVIDMEGDSGEEVFEEEESTDVLKEAVPPSDKVTPSSGPPVEVPREVRIPTREAARGSPVFWVGMAGLLVGVVLAGAWAFLTDRAAQPTVPPPELSGTPIIVRQAPAPASDPAPTPAPVEKAEPKARIFIASSCGARPSRGSVGFVLPTDPCRYVMGSVDEGERYAIDLQARVQDGDRFAMWFGGVWNDGAVEGYLVRFDADDDALTLARLVGSSEIVLQGVEHELDRDWHWWRLVRSDRTLRFELDGKSRIEVELDEAPGTEFGFVIEDGSVGFQRLSVVPAS